MPIRFDAFTLDPDTRQLLRGRDEIRLSPKAFNLLAVLLEKRPKVLDKRELLARIWPDTFVVEANLNVLVGELRRALDDDPKAPRFIRTVHGTGYAFSGDATDLAAAPAVRATAMRCWLVWNERRYLLAEGDNLIGRDPQCHVWLDATRVSREHARISVDSGARRAVLQDVGSTNGTFLEKAPVKAAMTLADGNVIDIGSVELTFRAWAGDKPPETERIRRRGRQ